MNNQIPATGTVKAEEIIVELAISDQTRLTFSTTRTALGNDDEIDLIERVLDTAGSHVIAVLEAMASKLQDGTEEIPEGER